MKGKETETFELITRDVAGYHLDCFGGTCSSEEWEHGEGIFLEKKIEYPERPGKIVAVIENEEGYAYYGMAEKAEPNTEKKYRFVIV